jgi:ADP-ribose pyrophosphatase
VKPDSARRVFEGRVITVVVERWGEHEREVVEHPGAVAIVATNPDGDVVLVRQVRQAVRRELLEIPAGTLTPGEDPLAAAKRELREETGFGGGEWRAGPRFLTAPGFCQEVMYLFFAEDVQGGAQAYEDDEEIEVVLVPGADLERRLEEIEDAKSLVGLLLHLRSGR